MVYSRNASPAYSSPICDFCWEYIDPNASLMEYTSLEIYLSNELESNQSPLQRHQGHICSGCDPIEPTEGHGNYSKILYYYEIAGAVVSLAMVRLNTTAVRGERFWVATAETASEAVIEVGNELASRISPPRYDTPERNQEWKRAFENR